MAENKKSVLLYCDIIHTVEKLSNEDAGILFKHYLRYINDQNPEPVSELIDIVFEPIKQNLKRDLKKWEAKSLKNSENAKVRWNANASERMRTDANHADIVKDIVTVTDKVKENVSVIKTPLLEIFFKDLPTSSNFETISMSLNIPKETLSLKIPLFRKAAKVEYPNFNEFCNHFKNWVKKLPADQPTKKRNHIDI